MRINLISSAGYEVSETHVLFNQVDKFHVLEVS